MIRFVFNVLLWGPPAASAVLFILRACGVPISFWWCAYPLFVSGLEVCLVLWQVKKNPWM